MADDQQVSGDELSVQQLFDLTGKVAMITGGSGWLGNAMARALGEAGATVVVTSSRDEVSARRVADQLPQSGGSAMVKHHGVQLDHMSEASIEQGFDNALKKAGKIDILVNNGLSRTDAGDGIDKVTAKAFSQHQVNNTGYFLLARRLHAHATERKAPASIVMIGSMYGVVGSYPQAYEGICEPSPVAYHALKGGLIHLTRHLAVYWAKDRVRVNCLSPGAFPNEGIDPRMVTRLEQHCPMGRMGLPGELKGALLLFASDAGSYITGQNLLIDGGWTAW